MSCALTELQVANGVMTAAGDGRRYRAIRWSGSTARFRWSTNRWICARSRRRRISARCRCERRCWSRERWRRRRSRWRQAAGRQGDRRRPAVAAQSAGGADSADRYRHRRRHGQGLRRACSREPNSAGNSGQILSRGNSRPSAARRTCNRAIDDVTKLHQNRAFRCYRGRQRRSQRDESDRPTRHRAHPRAQPAAAHAYLARVQATIDRPRGPDRMGCANVAHAFAALPGSDRFRVVAEKAPQSGGRHRLQRHVVGAPALRGFSGGDPRPGAPARRDGAGRRRRAGDVRRRHPGPAGHGAEPVLARHHRDVDRHRADPRCLRCRAAARRVRQDRSRAADRRAAFRPPAVCLRAGRADEQRAVEQ